MSNLKFTEEQKERRKVVHDATLDYCKILTEDNDIKLDNYTLSDIAEFASERVTEEGHKVHYPAIVYLGDDKQVIKDYIEKGDITTVRKMINDANSIGDSEMIDLVEKMEVKEEILDQNGEVIAVVGEF